MNGYATYIAHVGRRGLPGRLSLLARRGCEDHAVPGLDGEHQRLIVNLPSSAYWKWNRSSRVKGNERRSHIVPEIVDHANAAIAGRSAQADIADVRKPAIVTKPIPIST
jgi:hypothetical protein